MKQNILSVLSIIGILHGQSATVNAQTDSLTQSVFQNTVWNLQILDKEVVGATFHFKQKELFNANENIHIIKYSNKNARYKPSFVSAGDSLFKTSRLAKQES